MREWACIAVIVVLFGALFMNMSEYEVAISSWIALTLAVLVLGCVVMSGRQTRARSSERIANHRIHITTLTACMLVGVVGIEIAVRKVGGMWGDPLFVAFHLLLVAGVVATFVAVRFRYTGAAYKTAHKKLVYLFAFFFVGSYATGTALLLERFPLYAVEAVAGK